MKTTYIVIDEDGERSRICTDTSRGHTSVESFAKFSTAEKRAKQLAEIAPDNEIQIFELVGTAKATVTAAETARKYPSEHYKR